MQDRSGERATGHYLFFLIHRVDGKHRVYSFKFLQLSWENLAERRENPAHLLKNALQVAKTRFVSLG
jgi:hypothetical protein